MVYFRLLESTEYAVLINSCLEGQEIPNFNFQKHPAQITSFPMSDNFRTMTDTLYVSSHRLTSKTAVHGICNTCSNTHACNFGSAISS